ncbi:MAG: VCBS domain-containing protein, partial [Paracraurococcus sp.]
DAAGIAGSATGAVAEDGTLTASGALTIADPDSGEAVFATPASLAGTYGSFGFDAVTGAWSYALDNAAVDALNAGDQVTDRLTVTSLDGTASQDIVVTIDGTTDFRATADFWIMSNGAGTSTVGSFSGTSLVGNDVITAAATNRTVSVGAAYTLDGSGNQVAANDVVISAQADAALDSTFTVTLTGNATSVFHFDYTVSAQVNGTPVSSTGTVTVARVATTAAGDTIALDGSTSVAGAFSAYYDRSWIDGKAGTDSIAGGTSLNGGLGSDTLIGGAGNDTLSAGPGNDSLLGGTEDDRFVAGAGDDSVDGGAGTDTVVFTGNMDVYGFAMAAGGGILVSGATGTQTLKRVERLVFDDQTVVLADQTGTASDVTALATAVTAATGLSGGVTVLLADATYTLASKLNITKAGLTLRGVSRDGVIINSTATRGTEDRTIEINAIGVTLQDLTLAGWQATTTATTAGKGYLAWVNNAAGDGATFDGVKFVNNDTRVSIYIGTADDITVTDSLFAGSLYRYAIRGAGESMAITDNRFDLSFYQGGPIYFEYGAATSGVISGNTFRQSAGATVLSSDATGQFKSDGSDMFAIANFQPNQITADGLVITGNSFAFLNADAVNSVTGARPQPVAILNDPQLAATGPITITGNSITGYGYQAVSIAPEIVTDADAARGGVLDLDGYFGYATFVMPDSIGDRGTLNLWVKLDSDATGRRNQIVEGPGNGAMEFQYRSNSSGQFYGSPNQADASGANFVIMSGSAGTTAQSWTSLQYTWDKNAGTGGTMKIYLNGSEVGYATNFGSSRTAWNNVVETLNGVFSVGADPADASRMLKGRLDDLAFFNEVLSTSQLAAVRQKTADISTANYGSLVTYWSFEEAAPNGVVAGSGGTTAGLTLSSLLPLATAPVVSAKGGTGAVRIEDNSFLPGTGSLAASLTGGTGNDILAGTPGDDSLAGGAGADTFVFRGDFGVDRIADFDGSVDRIDIEGSFDAAAVGSSGGHMTYTVSAGNVIRFTNLPAGSTVEAGWFV